MKKDLNKLSFQDLKKEIEQLEKKKKSIPIVKLKNSPYVIGENYFIRTVTMIYTGKLIKVYEEELVLTNCCWIADTGRYSQAIATGKFDEVEPYPSEAEIILGKDSILDSHKVNWKLPKDQK